MAKGAGHGDGPAAAAPGGVGGETGDIDGGCYAVASGPVVTGRTRAAEADFAKGARRGVLDPWYAQ